MIDQKQVEFLKEFWAVRLRESTECLQKHPDNERACKDNFRALHALEILGVKL
jgi:hypothetical protein